MEQMANNWQSKYAERIKVEREQKLKRGMNELLNRRFKSKRRNAMRTTLIVITILLLAFAYVLLRETDLVRQRYDNAELSQKITDLKLANESKKEQLAKLFDAKTLTAKAREIGLEKASQDQIINVPVPQINQLSINLQSANAKNYEKSGEAIDFKLIYKNLADYFENLNSQQSDNKLVDSSVKYRQKEANGILLRKAGEIDPEYVKQVKANALKTKESQVDSSQQTQEKENESTLVTNQTATDSDHAQANNSQQPKNMATETHN